MSDQIPKPSRAGASAEVDVKTVRSESIRAARVIRERPKPVESNDPVLPLAPRLGFARPKT